MHSSNIHLYFGRIEIILYSFPDFFNMWIWNHDNKYCLKFFILCFFLYHACHEMGAPENLAGKALHWRAFNCIAALGQDAKRAGYKMKYTRLLFHQDFQARKIIA